MNAPQIEGEMRIPASQSQLPQLDKWELLMVRHCKKNSVKMGIFRRILAKRCGHDVHCISDEFVMGFLTSIMEKFGVIDWQKSDFRSMRRFLGECAPSKSWQYGKVKWDNHRRVNEDTQFYKSILNVIVSRLGLTEIVIFNGSYRRSSKNIKKHGE